MKSSKVIRNSIAIASVVFISLISLIFVYIYFEKVLDEAFNSPGGKTHTEMMLWKSPGYSKEPQLNFYKFSIIPDLNNIRVNYRIENTSDKVIQVENEIDIEVLDGDPKSHGDPGKLVWKWSQIRGERKIDTTSVAPGGLFQEEIHIDRMQAKVSQQYYVNAYYKEEIVAQYKIIEGIYNK